MHIDYNDNICVNCPFDDLYSPILRAIIFTIISSGFYPRGALEEDDASNIRIDKILQIVGECKYGIHDISRTELDCITQLPRFNMPFELGISYVAKKFGNKSNKSKVALVFEREKYSYQKFISDINGSDLKAHKNDYKTVIIHVRNWLSTVSKRTTISGYKTIIKDYEDFIKKKFDQLCTETGLNHNQITFNNFCLLVEES